MNVPAVWRPRFYSLKLGPPNLWVRGVAHMMNDNKQAQIV